MKTNYYAYFNPSEGDGHYHIPTLNIFDKIDTNRAKLVSHLLAYVDGYTFESYPVELVVMNDDTEEVVEVWEQMEEDGKWRKRKGVGR